MKFMNRRNVVVFYLLSFVLCDVQPSSASQNDNIGKDCAKIVLGIGAAVLTVVAFKAATTYCEEFFNKFGIKTSIPVVVQSQIVFPPSPPCFTVFQPRKNNMQKTALKNSFVSSDGTLMVEKPQLKSYDLIGRFYQSKPTILKCGGSSSNAFAMHDMDERQKQIDLDVTENNRSRQQYDNVAKSAIVQNFFPEVARNAVRLKKNAEEEICKLEQERSDLVRKINNLKADKVDKNFKNDCA